MSSLSYDFHSVCIACQGCECKECRDVSDDVTEAYVKHQKSLESKLRSRHKSKSGVYVSDSSSGEGECNMGLGAFPDILSTGLLER